ncbi:mannose/cellobiose epimerase-like protein (N-acyl-D-glucosamine 2-epimerase family) [Duganella sp. SG902]|uniref:AGE family epimerase/isomerase n=1 Tax=Duganella sp. SG902 TaxID=2587016 RepID=UPI00159E3FD5|nr:AGE family epimerase/isomerase [Duganella sp. SG902]NVM77566.1 mannose/cellobiose epimerase-like protein (N-acyl-D-glucosamine 2-epimerase family) [Duganella sp. SG902]
MTPQFRSPEALQQHIQETMRFYHPRCIDPSGGFHHFFKDDGTVYDHATRHLVSSTRFVFNYAMAHRHFPSDEYLSAVRHGVAFLRDVHRDPVTGGYAWQLRWDGRRKTVEDGENHCYGLAFVLLAYSQALAAGVEEAREWMAEVYQLMEQHFWEEQHGLYADQALADWSVVLPYRGQNANMHACEALITAYEASGERRYLLRAEKVARNITQRQAAPAGGRIWEHYDANWQIDWDYNRDDKTNIFRPWGFQPGHFTEWAKLLLLLERHLPADWLLPRAIALFDDAIDHAWDNQHGGMVYGFGPDNSICDGDKYFWVQAESLAAAAVLAVRTGQERFWDEYDRLWRYSWTHMIDHRHGAWYRILSRDNRKLSDEKSPAGKTDYHTMGACYEVLRALGSEA